MINFFRDTLFAWKKKRKKNKKEKKNIHQSRESSVSR